MRDLKIMGEADLRLIAEITQTLPTVRLLSQKTIANNLIGIHGGMIQDLDRIMIRTIPMRLMVVIVPFYEISEHCVELSDDCFDFRQNVCDDHIGISPRPSSTIFVILLI